MNANKVILLILSIVSAAMFSTSIFAETMKFNGSASTTSHQIEMPLANGGASITYNATGVAAMSGSASANPILLSLRCNGLGVALPEAKGGIEFYCTFIENGTDKFDVKGTENAGEAQSQVTIIGGSGRWANATGSGNLKRTSMGEYSSNSTFHLTIETP